jgi:hypothetical protein
MLFINGIFAQDISGVNKDLAKVNILVPGIVYEHGFSPKLTLYSEASLGFLYNYSSAFGSSSAFNLNLNEQVRYYYNFEKRLADNKRVKNNSANYFGVSAFNSFKPFAGNNLERFVFVNTFSIGPVWGLQRTYKGNFNLDLNLGFAAKVSQYNTKPIIPIVNFSLGWIVFDK